MKELSIKEKAERYDEAIKVAKGNYETIVQMDNDCTFAKEGIVNTFHHIFPELKESEDERIRKEIITFIVTTPKERNNHKKWIAWLEKQGEHANFRNKIQIGDKVTRNEDGVLVNLSQLKRVAKKDEKQGEQKPAWSEEDERRRKRIVERLEDIRKSKEDNIDVASVILSEINLLKSLKDRVRPKTKQEWSEEDEKVLHAIRNALNYEKPRNYLKSRDFEFTDILDWLKSLRPQNTWKPSERQLECLGYAIDKAEKDWSPLINNRIYLTLKALKEQLLELKGSKV